MKFTVDTKSLRKALDPCADVANPRSPSFYGKCVLLVATGGSLTVQAYNVPISQRATIAGDALTVSAPGRCAVLADEIQSRIALMPDDRVTLDTSSGKLVIKGGASKRSHTIRIDPGTDYPSFPSRPVDEITLAADKLASVLRGVTYAAQDDPSTPLFGVSVEAANDTLTATAAGNNRAARECEAAPDGASLKTFVPLPAARALLAVLGKGDVTVCSSDLLVFVSYGGVEIAYNRPAEGIDLNAFVARVTSKEGPRVGRKDLIDAVRGLAVDGASGNVQIDMWTKGDSIHLRHVTMEGEVSTDELACSGATEYTWNISLEARYLLEALRSIGADDVDVCVSMSEVSQPVVFRHANGLAMVSRILPDHAAAHSALADGKKAA